MDKKEILQANKIVFDFILNLGEDDLKAVIKGEKKILIIDKEKKISNIKSISRDLEIDEIIKKLYSYKLKEEAIKYLNGFKVVDLKKVVKEIDIFIKSRSKKSEIIDRIVEGTIGVKMKIDILQN